MNSKDETVAAALEEYIAVQRTLLEQTNRDIVRLQQLRERVLEDPLAVVDNLSVELDDDAFRLSRSAESLHASRQLSSLVDPGVFKAKNPELLKLSLPKNDQGNLQKPPARTDLQNYVHQSSINLLSKLDRLSPSPTPPPCPPPNPNRPLSPLSATLDPRNIKTVAQNSNGLRRTSRVHKPKLKEAPSPVEPIVPPIKRQKRRLPSVRTRSNSTRSIRTESPVVSRASPAPSESVKAASLTLEAREKLTIRIPPLRIPPRPQAPLTPEENSKLEGNRRKGDINSETFNQPWSVEEQHLLERLLIEIPRGEKNRWAKISKAMGGRRSSRQVASRVQKYFDKLEKAGITHAG